MSAGHRHVPDVSPSAAFDAALRAAIAQRGLALSRVQARLAQEGHRVGVATLSTWQTGRRVPRSDSRAIISALEAVLELPDGWLAVRLPEQPNAGRKPFGKVVDYSDSLVRLLGEVRRDAHGRTRILSIVEELIMGPDRALLRKSVIHTVYAAQETDRVIVTQRGEDGADPGLTTLCAVSGCRVGRVARDEETAALVAELLLDRMLRVGETAVLRYEVLDGNTLPSDFYFRFNDRPCGQYVIEVQFDPAALPVRVHEFHRRTSQEPDAFRRELTVSAARRVHVVVPQVDHAIVGIDWEWE